MKVALVTGGNKGIGYELCRNLVQAGHFVLLATRNEILGLEAIPPPETGGSGNGKVHRDRHDKAGHGYRCRKADRRRIRPTRCSCNQCRQLGSLTLNSDPAWKHGNVKLIGYNASKAALNMLTVQLAWELRGTNIKVNSVNPGFTRTDLNRTRARIRLRSGFSSHAACPAG